MARCHVKKFGMQAHWHVKCHGTLARKTIWHVGTKARRHVGTLARWHVTGHGTLARKKIWHVDTLASWHVTCHGTLARLARNLADS